MGSPEQSPGEPSTGRPQAGDTLLAGSVVMVTGVGPDLGRAVAVRCARAGADLILAARTALAEFGRVDALVHNAFAMPPMTSLADTSLDAIRAAFETNALAALRLVNLLATELGPRGIRVNSVAPGWIWGTTLQWYFGYLAKERGVDRQDVYDETAAATDLRRLPEPDEIADAVAFLASPLARAITGQCLDVNCGEFHH
jgi:NAD(P)-dependent dehydrogenase (short-subunit alcohol dehydrogenase family)